MRTVLITLFILASAFAVAALCILPGSRGLFPFWLIAGGAHVADTLFHELGHTLFSWLFGQPAVPMIFTLLGADQAGGMTIPLTERNWVVQGMAFAAMGYACYRLWENESALLIPAILFSLAIGCLAFTPYYLVIILFMGHGGAVTVGGWLLYRAWLYLDSRNPFERWLNGFFGFFLILHNFYFSYMLAFDSGSRQEYTAHVAFGISDNDFQVIADHLWRWSVKGIAEFMMGYCCAVTLASLAIAVWRRDDYGMQE